MYAKNKITNEKRPARAQNEKNTARFHYGHCAFNTRKQCALSLRSLRFQHTQTMRAFTTVTVLSTHANTVRFHYGHCAFNTRAKPNKMSMQKNKWQPKRVMWITATRRRPMTRFLHACGSVRGQMRRWPCGRVGVLACVRVVCKCAGVRVCGKSHCHGVRWCVCASVRVCECAWYVLAYYILGAWHNGTHFLTSLGVSAILLVFVSRIAFSGATDVLGTSVCRLAMHHITST